MVQKKTDIGGLMAKAANNTLTLEDRILLEQLRRTAFEHDARSRKSPPDASLYNPADPHSAWKNPAFRAAYEAQVAEPIYMSRSLKTVLISMVILAIITVTGLFYLTITSLKSHKYPAKTVPRHSYRLR
jgi:hypothetical protein